MHIAVSSDLSSTKIELIVFLLIHAQSNLMSQ